MDKQTGYYPTEVRASRATGGAGPGRPARKPKMKQVGALHPTAAGVTCALRVLEAPREVEVARKNGAGLKFWEVLCGDQTGKVVLSVTADQKEGLVPDKVIVVRNGHIKMVNSFMRLVVDKWGKLDFESG